MFYFGFGVLGVLGVLFFSIFFFSSSIFGLVCCVMIVEEKKYMNKKIVELRNKLGLSRVAFAKDLGSSATQMKRMENGDWNSYS